MVGIRSPDGLVVGACTSHLGVLGSIPKREEPGKTGRNPVLKYRVPHGSHVIGTAVININTHTHERAACTDSDSRFPTLIIYVRMYVCVCVYLAYGAAAAVNSYCSAPCLPPPPPHTATHPAMGRLVHIGLGSQSLVTHVLQSPPTPLREQLCNRYYSHKHTHLHGVRHGNWISCSLCVRLVHTGLSSSSLVVHVLRSAFPPLSPSSIFSRGHSWLI
jgi:hypothetical protein